MPVRPLNAIAGLAQRLILPTDEEFVFEPMDPLDIFGRDEWRRNASRSARARTAERVGGGDAEFVGESIGFFKIAPADFPLLIKETHARSRGSSCADSYDDVLRTLVLAGRFGYEDVTGLPWIEIDFPADVIRAQNELVPAIIRSA